MADRPVLNHSPFALIASTAPGDVVWTDGFWQKRFEQTNHVTLPVLFNLMDDPDRGHALTNLRIMAGDIQGVFKGTHWQDEWVYKWLEAAAHTFGVTHDPNLDRRMDELIDIIGKAQQSDGYIASQITLRHLARLQDPHHHELYVMGHLISAACVHRSVTNKENFLIIACKCADYLYTTFSSKRPELAHFGFNPSYIMALVDLFRLTRNPQHLELARIFIDMRGSQPGGSDLNQDRVPLVNETQIIGHSVLSTYLYSGAADYCMETGDDAYLSALKTIWSDMTQKRLYINGGVCALHRSFSVRHGRSFDDVHEAAGDDYELPNSTAYNETCAQIGSFFWNWRMFRLTGSSQYVDLMEHTLYNGILVGIDLAGENWFYTNVLRHYGHSHVLHSNDSVQRFKPGLNNICCPSNLLRLMASLQNYAYGLADDGIYVNLYGSNQIKCDLEGSFEMRQHSDYPLDGQIDFEIRQAPDHAIAIHFRIPSWAAGASLSVCGTDIPVQTAGAYIRVNRIWQSGDTVRLSLPMKPRIIAGNQRIESVRGQVAVLRGPLLYCLESTDYPANIDVMSLAFNRNSKLTCIREEDELDGIVSIYAEGTCFPQQTVDCLYMDWSHSTQNPQIQPLRFIPYYTWNNRGPAQMTVWVPVV